MNARATEIATARIAMVGFGIAIALHLGGCSGLRYSALCRAIFASASPCELDPPGDVAGNFLLRQLVEIHYGEHHLSLETAVQKRGDTLTIVGLTPVAGKLFTIVLHKRELTYDSAVWRDLPFPPCRIVRDFERVHFPLVGGRNFGSKTVTGKIAGEAATESWRDGRPLRRRIGGSCCGTTPVVIDYLDWRDDKPLPVRARLVDEASGYVMTTELLSVELLSP